MEAKGRLFVAEYPLLDLLALQLTPTEVISHLLALQLTPTEVISHLLAMQLTPTEVISHLLAMQLTPTEDRVGAPPLAHCGCTTQSNGLAPKIHQEIGKTMLNYVYPALLQYAILGQ